jgi:hypothetical protein
MWHFDLSMSEILIFIRKRESNGYRCKVWCCHKQPTTIHTTGETNVSCNWGKLFEHFVIPLDCNTYCIILTDIDECQSDVTSPANYMSLLHRVCIFQLYLEFVWRNSIFLVKSLLIYDSRSILKCSHGTFVTFIQENGVPRGKLQLLGFFHYNFWHKMLTSKDMKLAGEVTSLWPSLRLTAYW